MKCLNRVMNALATARRSDERGSGTLEVALVFPAVMLLTFGAVQAGIYEYSRNLALASAQIGAREAAAEKSTAGAGAAAARSYATRVNNNMVTNIQVTANRGATQATVTVTCDAPSLTPGLSVLHISQTASLPVERTTR